MCPLEDGVLVEANALPAFQAFARNWPAGISFSSAPVVVRISCTLLRRKKSFLERKR